MQLRSQYASTQSKPVKKKRDTSGLKLRGVTMVRTREEARAVLPLLLPIRDRRHACDTETTGVNPKTDPIVGNGQVICFSVYCGPDIDFGEGPRLWVDTWTDPDVLWEFESYFADEGIQKLWHNYGFDRHMVENHGLKCRGFRADTMHKARLWDAGRLQFSLESLTEDLLGRRKVPMKERFGKPNIKKNGEPGKQVVTPSTLELQTDPVTFLDWVDYSTYDTEGLWLVDQELDQKLLDMEWHGEKTMLDFYEEQWLFLGETLTRMEKRGIAVNVEYLAEIQPIAEREQAEHEREFKSWASQFCPDVVHMNVGSDKQLQCLLFAPFRNEKNGEHLAAAREFKVDNVEGWIAPGKKKALKKRPITLTGMGITCEAVTKTGWPQVGGVILDDLAGDIDEGEWGRAYMIFGGAKDGVTACKAFYHLAEAGRINTLLSNFIIPLQRFPDKLGRIHPSININTETGRLSIKKPSAQNQPALEKDRYFIRDAFTATVGLLPWQKGNIVCLACGGDGCDDAPNMACWACDGHGELSPTGRNVWPVLKGNARHGMLTEPEYGFGTKDQINALIVADYGQLELRVLAHLSNCASMIQAFIAGGDFHSRTATDMFEHITIALSGKECVLEEDGSGLPTVKELFASERRKGKTLNFSVAYGKTAYGFSKDWNVSVEEAQATLDKWYESRPEVRDWQRKTIAKAYKTGSTRTLGGRYRPIPDLFHKWKGKRAHGERVAINTPVQGGAADIVNAATIKIENDEYLKSLGWRMILQVHDELVSEGPMDTAEEAKAIIVDHMANPFSKPLRIELTVDAKIETTWYLAK